MAKNKEQLLRQERLPLLSTVLGAGGPFAIAYNSGICKGLEEKGIAISRDDGPITTTSGGAWAAGFLELGMTREEVEEIPPVKFPYHKKNYLLDIGKEVFGDARSKRIGSVALRLPSLRQPIPRTEVLWDEEIPIAQKAAATSAIPVGYHSVKLNGKRYIDGGATLSFTHADMAPAAEHLLVVAALGRYSRLSIGPLKDPAIVGRHLEMRAKLETRRWQKMHQGQTDLILPTPEIGGLIEHFSDIFVKKIAQRAYDMAIEQAHQEVEERPSLKTLAAKMATRISMRTEPPSAAL